MNNVKFMLNRLAMTLGIWK